MTDLRLNVKRHIGQSNGRRSLSIVSCVGYSFQMLLRISTVGPQLIWRHLGVANAYVRVSTCRSRCSLLAKPCPQYVQ